MTPNDTVATRPLRWRLATAVTGCAIAVLAACTSPARETTPAPAAAPTGHAEGFAPPPTAAVASPAQPEDRPYAHTGATDLSAAAGTAKPLVYVPNQLAGTVQVIDPATYAVIANYRVGRSPEHVVPSHDLATLWVNSDAGDSVTPIDPTTGTPGASIRVDDPYNLYFTPNGSAALVMAERVRRIDVRDPHTMALQRSLPVPCAGLNHADYSADLTRLVASCEFSGQLLLVDANATTVSAVLDLNPIATPGGTSPADAKAMGGPKARAQPGVTAMPQDVRLSPDGRSFLVADMLRNGVWVINAATFTVDHFVHTGIGAHGIYPSRDATRLYLSNRDEGSITVLDATTLNSVATWHIPGGGSPDMGGVTANGSELWLSGRYNSVVYDFDTTTGQVTHTIPVRPGPHGLLVWPQPGRISLGHTGNMR